MSIGVAILSGGESKRFQKHGFSRKDKALEIVNGKRMIEWVIDTAYQVSDKVTIIVRDEEQVKSYSDTFSKNYPNLHIIADMEGFGHSPLVGLVTGARMIEDDLILVLPCDTPHLKRDVLKLLVDKANGFDAISPLWPDGKIEPLMAVYKREHLLLCYPALLSLKRWRPDDIIRGSKKSYLINVENMREFDEELNSFFNINYPKDIKSKKRIKSIKGIKEDKIIYPNNISIEKIKEAVNAIIKKDLNPKLIDDLKDSPFWLSILSVSLYDKFGREWLESAGKSFEDEANYYLKEEERMLALHAIMDALSCWKGLGSMKDVKRLSKETMKLEKRVGIDFEGKYLR